MKLSFRQGLVRVQSPAFTQITGSYVTLLANNTPTVVTISHGNSEYLISEPRDVTNAWGPFAASTYWLYWDVNPNTGIRTFGYTTLQPTHGPTAPVSPSNDQHWFDTSVMKMKVWSATGSTWVEKIRIFAVKLLNGATLIPYVVGTQVGIATTFSSGKILFDGTGSPIKKSSGEFFTSEDKFLVNDLSTNGVKLETAATQALAQENLAAYQVVYFSSFGKVNSADYDDVGNSVVAITTSSAVTDAIVDVVIQGTVTNSSWNWTTVGAPLWVLTGGLVDVDPHFDDPGTYPTGTVPVARVLAADTIIFEQGLGGKGDTGPSGSVNIADASTTVRGLTKLSVAPVSASNPIACGDNDSRLSNARTPTSHVHAASTVTSIPTGGITATEVQTAIQQLEANKLNKSGGTMTGALTLSGDPTVALHAVTKQYVDGLVSGLHWLDPITQHINLIADNLNTPPISPNTSDVYIVAAGGTGLWSGLDGRVVLWNGSTWTNIGLLTGLTGTVRYGIAMETPTTPGGSFVGRKNQIANYSGGIWTYYTPGTSDALYVSNNASLHAFHQYAFSGTAWVEFGGAVALTAGNQLSFSGNTLNVVEGSGSGLDADTVDGYHVADLFANAVVDTFSGTGAQTIFTLSVAPGSLNATQVYISGVYQNKSAYTVVGTTLTFSAPPGSGTNNIQVVILGLIGSIGVPGDGTVTFVKMQNIATGIVLGRSTAGSGVVEEITVGSGAGEVAAGDHNHTGVYEPANANIQSHIGSTSNPHSVTASQTGAYTSSQVDTLVSDAKLIIENNQSDNYQLVLTDAGKLITLTGAVAKTFTVPPNSTVAFPIGTSVAFSQDGAGQLTIAAGGGVTIKTEVGLKLNAQYAGATAIKVATDTWRLTGSLKV